MLCNDCGNSYEPIKEHWVITSRDGLIQPCRYCQRIYKAQKAKKYRRLNDFNAYQRSYRAKTRNHQRVLNKKYYWQDPIKARQQAIAKYYENHEENKLRQRDQAKKHKARRLQYERNHPEIRRAAGQRWAARNPIKVKTKNHNRRAKMRNAEGKFTSQDIERQYILQNGECFYCHQVLNKVYHIDHAIPLSRGGSNWPSNLVCACPHCNLSKSDHIYPTEWSPTVPLATVF